MKATETVQAPVQTGILSMLSASLTEMRPLEWSKNLLVFSGLIFSRSLTDPHTLAVSVAGFLLFCCASSGVYLFNDLCDLAEDREHPVKRHRPLASGALPVGVARVAMVILFSTATLGALWLDHAVGVKIERVSILSHRFCPLLSRAGRNC